MRTLKLSLIVCAAALCSGCVHSAKVDWISIGPVFAPKSPAQVEVVQDYSELRHRFGAIGEMKGDSVPNKNSAALDEQARTARRLAAEHGADAIVLKKKELLRESSALSDNQAPAPEYYIHARAIKYVHNLTPEELETIQNWKPQTLHDLSGDVGPDMSDVDWNGRSR